MNNQNQYLCSLTRELWNMYISNFSENNIVAFNKILDEHISIIGTGSNEFFMNRDDFINTSTALMNKQSVAFKTVNEEYYCKQISDSVYIVYGKIWFVEDAENREFIVELNTRFSVVYKVENEQITIVHIHQSTPNIDQNETELYPKTLAAKANEAISLAKIFKERAERDLLTNLYNRITFENLTERALSQKQTGYFMMLDLDNFKLVNDTYGHEQGDILLQSFANILKSIFDDSIISRIGGDEFAILISGDMDQQSLFEKAKTILSKTADLPIDPALAFSCSIGILSIKGKNSFSELYKQADKALYLAKDNKNDIYFID